MFLGYADGHAAGTYCIWNPETMKVIISCNVIFLWKNYGDWNQEQESPRIIAKPTSMLAEADDEGLDIDSHIDKLATQRVKVKMTLKKKMNPKLDILEKFETQMRSANRYTPYIQD